ncbi:MAG: uracil-DNA glycosylase family protein [Candidatus Poseidoniales archaeon]
MGGVVETLVERTMRFRDACSQFINKLEQHEQVAHATNPLDYAWPLHEQYLSKWAGHGAKTILLGMNPGPFGMAQSGVPFGATQCVRDFLKIQDVDLKTPMNAHPKRPIEGLRFERQEISGTRIWNLLESEYHTPERCFSHVFVVNHCPLLLLGGRGQNITPDQLPQSLMDEVLNVCDQYLNDIVNILGIQRIVGVGKYAERRAASVFNSKKGVGQRDDGMPILVQTVWHPSPASPLANRNNGEDWKRNVLETLHKNSG